MINFSAMNSVLESERKRLLKIFTRLTRHKDTAEDLVQETLLEAWRQRHKLQTDAALSPWLTAIARNIALRWTRSQGHDSHHLLTLPPPSTDATEPISVLEEVPDTLDIELELERKELITLLDRALTHLPTEARTVLLERYTKDTPIHELAQQLNLHPNTLAKRLERHKATLQHILTANFTHELAPYLIPHNPATWSQTYLWCPLCGQQHLLARSSSTLLLEMTCPNCTPRINGTLAAFHVNEGPTPKGFGRLLETSFTWMERNILPALARESLPCPCCHRPLSLHFGAEADLPFPNIRRGFYDYMYQYCTCGYNMHNPREGLALVLPAGRHFWKTHRRIHLTSVHELAEVNGHPAIATTFASMHSHHQLTVTTARHTFQTLHIDQNS